MILDQISSDDALAAVRRMSPEDRVLFCQHLTTASDYLSNAAYAWSGNAPEAKPTPDEWAAIHFGAGRDFLEMVADDLARVIGAENDDDPVDLLSLDNEHLAPGRTTKLSGP